MKILVIDNYDSFTYNLVHYIEDIQSSKVYVVRNDKITIKEIDNYDKILLSPGPGLPEQAGIIKQIIKHYAATKSILGVCLGMQAIAEVFGGTLVNLDKVFHGVESTIYQRVYDYKLFRDIPNEFTAGRYHSWVVNNNDLPDELIVSSVDKQNNIMSLFHTIYDVRGIQFHPESVMTPHGKKIIQNWLKF